MTGLTSGERFLLNTAKRAQQWFANASAGNALNGQYDDVLLARVLREAIEVFEAERTHEECLDRR